MGKFRPAKKAGIVSPTKGPKPMNAPSAAGPHPMVTAVQKNNNTDTSIMDSENMAAMQMAANQ